MVTIRKARIEDAAGVARVPDSYLANVSYARREEVAYGWPGIAVILRDKKP